MFKAPIVLFLLFYSINFQAQDNSSTAFGSFGILNSYRGSGTVSLKAFNWSIGYQKSLKNERFRFVPVIHFGNFRSGASTQGQPDGYLSATNFNLGLDYDFKKGKITSFFVGICIQPFNALVDQVQKMMELNPEDQFALIDFEKASKAWVLTLLNKSIVLNKRGVLIEGFGNLSDPNFEKVLEGL